MKKVCTLLAVLFTTVFAQQQFFNVFNGQAENFTQEIYSLAPIRSNLNIGIGFVNGRVITIEAGLQSAYIYAMDADLTQGGTSYRSFSTVNWPSGYGYYNFINHPDGHIYAATTAGNILKLDPNNNFAQVPIDGKLANQRVNAGAALGMAVDPQDNRIIYYARNTAIWKFDVTTGNVVAVPNTGGSCFDGIFFNDNGTILAVADPCANGVRFFGRNGGQLALVNVPGGPDGMAFHTCSNTVFSINNDGTLWRINLTDYSAARFAAGGSRGDIGAVGPDGCFYMNFYGSNRLANG